nr:retinal rod rhodopsin-sensitive cGMP 3',5'-cyclic phosphodiesterase subunit gamma isoform X1 [Pogona vitticeps]
MQIRNVDQTSGPFIPLFHGGQLVTDGGFANRILDLLGQTTPKQNQSARISNSFWWHFFIATMSLEPPKLEITSATKVTGGPVTPRKGPPKFKQRQTRQFKSKPPKKGIQGFGDDIPGMEGLGTDITVICPWEAFSHLELHELAQYGII